MPEFLEPKRRTEEFVKTIRRDHPGFEISFDERLVKMFDDFSFVRKTILFGLV